MRLTCPNCDAQYEVPDEVIPEEGRDVQCSNCGDTWFQAKSQPDNAGQDSDTPPVPTTEEGHSAATQDLRAALSGRASETPQPQDDPAQQQERSSEVTEILRQEAEREENLRAADTADTLESQPDLGLDNMPGDESDHRAREARDRMARMRGQDPAQSDHGADPGSRRGTLPDIEEISSTLRSSDSTANTAVGPARTAEEESPQEKRRGFTRGFALIMVLGVALMLIYSKSSSISQAIPQAAPALEAYVGLVDQARIWIDARLGEYVPK